MANRDELWYMHKCTLFSVHNYNVTVYIQGIAGHLKLSVTEIIQSKCVIIMMSRHLIGHSLYCVYEYIEVS